MTKKGGWVICGRLGIKILAMKRLTVIVAYRDREEHLRQFVPHMRPYFARDKFDKDNPYRALIVQQAPFAALRGSQSP